MRRFLGNLRNRLNSRGACANHAHPLACEVNRLVGPVAGVEALAGKVVNAGNVRPVGGGQGAHRADEELGGDSPSGAGVNRPTLCCLVVAGIAYPSVEPDVAPQVEPVGYML